jgi:hypothetical protein
MKANNFYFFKDFNIQIKVLVESLQLLRVKSNFLKANCEMNILKLI